MTVRCASARGAGVRVTQEGRLAPMYTWPTSVTVVDMAYKSATVNNSDETGSLAVRTLGRHIDY